MTDSTTFSSPASPSTLSKVPVLRGAENRRSLKSVKIIESDIIATTSQQPETESSAVIEDKAIQHRPLPEIPPPATTKT